MVRTSPRERLLREAPPPSCTPQASTFFTSTGCASSCAGAVVTLLSFGCGAAAGCSGFGWTCLTGFGSGFRVGSGSGLAGCTGAAGDGLCAGPAFSGGFFQTGLDGFCCGSGVACCSGLRGASGAFRVGRIGPGSGPFLASVSFRSTGRLGGIFSVGFLTGSRHFQAGPDSFLGGSAERRGGEWGSNLVRS